MIEKDSSILFIINSEEINFIFSIIRCKYGTRNRIYSLTIFLINICNLPTKIFFNVQNITFFVNKLCKL